MVIEDEADRGEGCWYTRWSPTLSNEDETSKQAYDEDECLSLDPGNWTIVNIAVDLCSITEDTYVRVC